MKTILIVAATVLLGYSIGATPGLNENLHWNLWFVIPVSGLILGMFIGWLQFFTAYAVNLRIGNSTAWLLAIAAAAAYLATEAGIYNAMMIPIGGVDGMPDGEYAVSALFTFQEYVSMTLSSTAYEGRGGVDYEYGGIATKLTYAVDVLACFAAAFMTRAAIAKKYPYCERCGLYKKRDTKFEAKMPAGDATADAFNKLMGLMEQRNYSNVVSFLKDLSGRSAKDGDVMITADQRCCPTCKEASIVGRVYKSNVKEWDEVDDLAFQFESRPGEHVMIG